MTVNMLSIVCVFHSFFTFFFIEGALAFRLFRVSCHLIYRFSSFSLLKSTVFSTLVFFFLFVLQCQAAFSFYERPTFVVCSGFDTFAIVFVLLFWSICENFQLLQSFNSREDLNSCFLKTRGRARFVLLLILIFAVRHFRWSTTIIYFLITIIFGVFAFFVASFKLLRVSSVRTCFTDLSCAQ